MAKKRERKLTVTQQIMQTAIDKLQKYENDVTRKTYTRQFKLFAKFCRETFNCRNFEECRAYIQDYSNYLQTENYTASTIHTYLAAVCAVYEINLETIRKPVRYVADYIRGRHIKNIDSKNDLESPQWAYIVEFQRCVGIRRDELKKLRGDDFLRDESGYFCVRVKKGKGGKLQYQRILEQDIEFVKTYFDCVGKDDYVFDRKYFDNDLNFHALRADAAKEYYREQLKRIKADPRYAEQLEKEIRARWMKMNLKKDGKPKNFRKNE